MTKGDTGTSGILQRGEDDPHMPAEWIEIAEDQRELLLEWYNTREEDIDAEDLKRLAALYQAGQIAFATCDECGGTCYDATPDDWGHFQGTGVGMVEGIYGDFCGQCAQEIVEKAKRTGLC